MNKKARSKFPLKPKAPLKWVLMDILPSTAPKSLTSDTTFSNYLLLGDSYPKIPNLYGMVWRKSQHMKLWKTGYVSIQIWNNWRFWVAVFIKNFIRCRYEFYIDRVQRRMPDSQSSFSVSGTWTSRCEQTSQSDLENVSYSCTLLWYMLDFQKRVFILN